MAFLAVLCMFVVSMFFALAFDAGLWFFDHRTSQNQADAAVLAAVQQLPAADVTLATNAANTWLTKNGSDPAERSCLVYSDRHPSAAGDGVWDTVKVCVRRTSPGVFANLSAIPFVDVSASATARVGPATMSNVLPWGIVPPDPTCTVGEICQNELLLDCGDFAVCPWGIDPEKLYVFMNPDSLTPGNYGAIGACGAGASDYADCITGEAGPSEFFAEGETVNVEAQTGQGVVNQTRDALADRYGATPGIGVSNEGADGIWECDVAATPTAQGSDPDGRALALDMYVDDPEPGCETRLIAIPILNSFPPQGHSADILVLGVATFGIASWDRAGQVGDDWGSPTRVCSDPPSGPPVPAVFECGAVWGYLFQNAQPPNFLLEQISDTNNPLAPLMTAMVE